MKFSRKKTIDSRVYLAAAIVMICLFFLAGCTGKQDTQTIEKSITRVGAILPLTGPTAYLGENERLSVELAIEAEKVDKSSIEFVFEDSQGKPELALTAARKLMDFQKIRVFVVTTTGPVLSVLPALRDSGNEILAIAQCMVPGVTRGFPFAYRLYATSDEETDLLSEYAGKIKLKKMGALHIRNQFGEEGVKFFKKKAAALGCDVVITESFTFSDKDFRTVIEKFKVEKVDGLIIYAYSTNFPLIFQQMQEAGLIIPVLGNSDLALGGLEGKINTEFLRNVVFPAPNYYFVKGDPKIDTFNELVKSRGTQPNFDMAYCYDMTKILIKAIQASTSKSPKDIANSIEKMMPYQGVSGTIRLNEDRDTRADMKLVRWGSSGIELVKPLDK